MSRPQRVNNHVIRLFVLLAVSLSAALLCAQSPDPNKPFPVRTNTITGSIAARDLGDARLTDHYYAFTGTPGDLLITVQSQNLNGDIDVFTAVTLRPLLKLTMYAESSTPTTKGIYLRRREDLILRVQARSPNDDEGTYRLLFGGSFEPIIGGPEISESETPTLPETAPGERKTKRVSSVGARINEPEPSVTEVAAAPEPTPEPTPEAKPVETPKAVEEKAAETTETARPATRNPRGRRSPARRTTPRSTETVRTPTERPAPEARSEPKPETAPEPTPETGPRLLIETNDGTLINRPMSGVRRVTVERGQVVVVGTDGKISRFLLANVVRMSITP